MHRKHTLCKHNNISTKSLHPEDGGKYKNGNDLIVLADL